MKITQQGEQTLYRFEDDKRSFAITKGGENLLDNTYGFEIEFCSHDSSVLAFTHVDVGNFTQADDLSGQASGSDTPWKIETDSNNVLELVTPPITFSSVGDARAFRLRLANALSASVKPEIPQHNDQDFIRAIFLEDWKTKFCTTLGELKPPNSKEATVWHFNYMDWKSVGEQLNVSNVDDGVNIPAARMRHRQNQHSWESYVGGTVLSSSEKDWGTGYSTQLNMPMSLPGYFLYCHHKLEQSAARKDLFGKMIAQPILAQDLGKMTEERLGNRMQTWFWRSAIWKAFGEYMRRTESKFYQDGVWTRNNKRRWNLKQVTNLSLMYVATSKILTGALGSLSEPAQLAFQQYAWSRNSTAAMWTESPQGETSLLISIGELLQKIDANATFNRKWLDYHSSLKSLTGLWFKGALFDVINKEQQNDGFMVDMGKILKKQTSVWPSILDALKTQVTDERWIRGMESIRPGYEDEFANLDVDTLAAKIHEVEIKLGDALIDSDSWKHRLLPPLADRPFLGYAKAPPWEGRYDTMYSPFKRGDDYTYLVEHRFH